MQVITAILIHSSKDNRSFIVLRVIRWGSSNNNSISLILTITQAIFMEVREALYSQHMEASTISHKIYSNNWVNSLVTEEITAI